MRTEQELLDFFRQLGVARNRQPAEHTEKVHLVAGSFNHSQRVAVCQFAYRCLQTGVLYVHYALRRKTVDARLESA